VAVRVVVVAVPATSAKSTYLVSVLIPSLDLSFLRAYPLRAEIAMELKLAFGAAGRRRR